MLAAQAVALGDIDVAVAGGMESMSNAPYLLPRVREGLRMGDATLVDAMIQDGLWCAFEHCHMGVTGEFVAEQFGVSREAQDVYAAESHQKAARATAEGRFKPEIVYLQARARRRS
jgi:acetyl-CoA C-acetyltransferase